MPLVQNLPSAHQEARASTWSPSLPLSQPEMRGIQREGLCLSPEQSKVELSRGSLACGPFLWTEEAGEVERGAVRWLCGMGREPGALQTVDPSRGEAGWTPGSWLYPIASSILGVTARMAQASGEPQAAQEARDQAGEAPGPKFQQHPSPGLVGSAPGRRRMPSTPFCHTCLPLFRNPPPHFLLKARPDSCHTGRPGALAGRVPEPRQGQQGPDTWPPPTRSVTSEESLLFSEACFLLADLCEEGGL